MKLKFLLLSIFVFSIQNLIAKACGCGSFESGTYDYTVLFGQGCCTGIPYGTGYLTLWIYDEEGVWEVSSVEEIKPIDAQKGCCSTSV
ncbi:hypothetical protein ACFS5J_02400 [Flavobacterium chuncheonense]|uniref:Uncharacterized protein n=1 Tax=Flavobacterium chuncheonense TaxID=2026653 RepID=A0ABW5YKC3_9FLAO